MGVQKVHSLMFKLTEKSSKNYISLEHVLVAVVFLRQDCCDFIFKDWTFYLLVNSAVDVLEQEVQDTEESTSVFVVYGSH